MMERCARCRPGVRNDQAALRTILMVPLNRPVSLAAGGSGYSYVPCQAWVAPQPVLSTSTLEVINAMIVQR
jgi:hypothetical protein